MNRNNIFKGLALGAATLLLGGCSSDYLQLEPETSFDQSIVSKSVVGARTAIRGAYQSMYFPYGAFGVGQRFFQGEPSLGTFYGEVNGVDAFYWVWGGYGADLFTWKVMGNPDTWMAQMGWSYCYNLINQANLVLDGIDDCEGDPAQRDLVKAQALTLRAHAYVRLMQIYCHRWEDSRNGTEWSIVLRTKAGSGDSPLVPANDVWAQIYSDLDTAIALYTSCGLNREYGWEGNIDVAYGVYARAAATKNDWAKCKEMAHNARASHPIMTAEQYMGGFTDANSEYIWYNPWESTDPGLGYATWGSMYACNGGYVSFWGFGAGAISMDLYRLFKDGDVRKDLYFTSDKPVPRPLNSKSFWNGNIIDPVSMNLNANARMAPTLKRFGENRVPNGDVARYGLPYQLETQDGAADNVVIPFGAQYKFWGVGQFAQMSFPFMRGAEMCLLEAEAAYRLNDPTTAQKCLDEITSKRFPADKFVPCTATGEELWTAIMTENRLELWGEGFSWFNAKRWNISIDRNPWIEGDVNSNNVPVLFEMHKSPRSNDGWRYVIFSGEYDYNRAVDVSLRTSQSITE